MPDNLIGKIKKAINTKQKIKEAIKARGVDVPEYTPFSEHPELINKISTNGIGLRRVHSVFSWIDSLTGDPKQERVEVSAGKSLDYPKGFPVDENGDVQANPTHNPAMHYTRTTGKVGQLKDGVIEDLIIMRLVK